VLKFGTADVTSQELLDAIARNFRKN